MADRARQMGNTTDTQFCLGSMNKMFTSIAILQLVGQGKLALESRLQPTGPTTPTGTLLPV
jgi:D-alanyl-D-alanine carboxypeptidase